MILICTTVALRDREEDGGNRDCGIISSCLQLLNKNRDNRIVTVSFSQ